MGQKLRDDKIGALSQAGGIITMTASSVLPAWLTIGGQQYRITSNRTVAVSGLTSHNLFYVYAVQTAGVVSLVISSNVNSVGPAGYLSWKLVGAFLSTFTSTFGDFINIEGAPQFDIAVRANTIGFSTATGVSVPHSNFNVIQNDKFLLAQTGTGFIAPVAGVYEVDFLASYDSNAVGFRDASYFVNAGAFRIQGTNANQSSTQTTMSGSDIIFLNKGDVYRCGSFHNLGSPLIVSTIGNLRLKSATLATPLKDL